MNRSQIAMVMLLGCALAAPEPRGELATKTEVMMPNRRVRPTLTDGLLIGTTLR